MLRYTVPWLECFEILALVIAGQCVKVSLSVFIPVTVKPELSSVLVPVEARRSVQGQQTSDWQTEVVEYSGCGTTVSRFQSCRKRVMQHVPECHVQQQSSDTQPRLSSCMFHGTHRAPSLIIDSEQGALFGFCVSSELVVITDVDPTCQHVSYVCRPKYMVR